MPLPRVAIHGRGKVGRALARALRAGGVEVRLRSGRSAKVSEGELVILAIPDGAIAEAATRIASRCARAKPVAVAHCAGALGASVLDELARAGVPVAQMHPLVSFASTKARMPAGAFVLVQGTKRAVTTIVRVIRAAGLEPLRGPVEPTLYHAAAAMVANGAVALGAAGRRLLIEAGVSDARIERALGALLESVAQNVAALGVDAALTGPVKRGDRETVEEHRRALATTAPDLLQLHAELVALQSALARKTTRSR